MSTQSNHENNQVVYPQIPTPMSQNVVVATPPTTAPWFIVRFIYFVFIGSWLSFWTIVLAYACMVTIIGIPIGIALLNRLPQITSLKPRSTTLQVGTSGSATTIQFTHGAQQRPWTLRALYFALVGWWVTGLYVLLAWLGVLVTLGWGAIVLYNPVPALLTLHRN